MRNVANSRKQAALLGLAFGALGVVFGDIGTSPLYALPAIFGPVGLQLPINSANVFGIISLIIWSVIIIVSIKYVLFVMRADNRGEGGIMALVARIKNDRRIGSSRHRLWLYIFIGLVGVALFYGDSTITPAISVLSAVEGLKVVAPELSRAVIPATVVLIVLLFWVQRYGTAFVGRIFAPVMALWFVTIGGAGAWQVVQHPDVLWALSPFTALQFFASRPVLAFLSLGAVILAVTGAEALYADMGHFGRRPIMHAWFGLVFPALVLCYMGQGALLVSGTQTAAESPFMALFPGALQIGALFLATAATLIASQSVISGAFSLTRQAIQLGFLPKMRVVHTSNLLPGQIYLPFINVLMFIFVVLLVVTFGSSAHLANAYGIAVSGTLAIDTLLFLIVARQIAHKPSWLVAIGGAAFVSVDMLFVTANIPKVITGGWFPILLSAIALTMMLTWYRGQKIVTAERRAKEEELQTYITKIRAMRPALKRIPGNAVYIGHHSDLAPLALHAAVEKLHTLHERVLIVSVRIMNVAHVPERQRVTFNDLAYDDGISQLKLSFGYHDTPNIPHELRMLRGSQRELDFDPDDASYFISLSRVVPGWRHNMAQWRKTLYMLMSRNALSASDYYRLPIERTVELRSLIEL